MTATLFTNISNLATGVSDWCGDVKERVDAAFVVDKGIIKWVGSQRDAPAADNVVDLQGNSVIPGFVDSHAHLVFAGDRLGEFNARMAGEKYAAGGIMNTVNATRAASTETLVANVQRLVREMHSFGITTYEIKSGYGLTVEDEIRSLEIARKFTDEVTLLAAHVVPPEYQDNRQGYIELIINEMIPRAQGIAKWFDVFCDRGAFTIDETRVLFAAATKARFRLRLHGLQLEPSRTVDLFDEFNITSIDHCTYLEEADMPRLYEDLKVATLLPAAEALTRSKFPDARKMIEAKVTIAIATDCNPGSSYTTSMPHCLSLAVSHMGMTPAEAMHAATYGGAMALENEDVGRLETGSAADFVVIDAPHYSYLMYRPGIPHIRQTWQSGKLIYDRDAK